MLFQTIQETRETKTDNSMVQLPPITSATSRVVWDVDGGLVPAEQPAEWSGINNLNQHASEKAKQKRLEKKISKTLAFGPSGLQYTDSESVEEDTRGGRSSQLSSGVDAQRFDELERRIIQLEEKTNMSLYNIEALLRRTIFQSSSAGHVGLHKRHSARHGGGGRSRHRYEDEDRQ